MWDVVRGRDGSVPIRRAFQEGRGGCSDGVFGKELLVIVLVLDVLGRAWEKEPGKEGIRISDLVKEADRRADRRGVAFGVLVPTDVDA